MQLKKAADAMRKERKHIIKSAEIGGIAIQNVQTGQDEERNRTKIRIILVVDLSEGLPIKSFVKHALKEIEEGINQNFIVGNVNFEVSVTASSKGKGKVNLRIVEAGADISNQTTQKLTFSVLSKRALAHQERAGKRLFKMLVGLGQAKKKRKKHR